LNASAEALTFTNTLLSTIRLQEHLGARIIISTLEPSISSGLLDLSSVTIVHRFTSPEWLRSLRTHLAAAATDLLGERPVKGEGFDKGRDTRNKNNTAEKIFIEIVGLKVGDALLFAPSAVVDLEVRDDRDIGLKRLGTEHLKINIRARLTTDRGKSVMAG